MSENYLKPSAKGRRDPLDNTKDGGLIVNPPRFAELGGLKSSRNATFKNRMTIKKPGNTRG